LNRSRWWGLAVVLALVAAGLWWKSHPKTEAPRYRSAAIERGSIETVVSATGTIRPVVQVEVGSQVSGTVSRLFTDYNARVRRGEVLCQLEPSSFQARAAQAEAAVARAVAALKEANRQLVRSHELMKDNYVSQADVDAVEVAVEQREADLKQARAQLRAAQVDLDNTTIRAPIDGVVIARAIDVGQTVAASLQAPKLFLIANDLSQMQVETRIDESDIGQIHPGLPATFTVDAYPDLRFEGRVEQVRLEPIVEQGVVTYTTVIHTRNSAFKLRPGMTANVSVLVSKRDAVLKAPSAALRFHPPMEGRGRMAGGAGAGGAAAAMRPAGVGSPEGARGAGGESVASREGGAPGAGAQRRARGGARGPGGMRGGPPGTGAAGTGAAGTGAAGAGARGGDAASGDAITASVDTPQLKPGVVFVLRDGRPVRVPVMTGVSDGAFVEVEGEGLGPGDRVIVGLEVTAQNRGLTPPPGMGGPQFGGPRGGGGRGGGR
jgi:HlyD family secretion protein